MFKQLFSQKKQDGAAPASKSAAKGSSFVPTGVLMKGDLAVRPYRRATKDPRKKKERDAFDAKLKELKSGYKSSRTLDTYDLKRTLGTGSFGRVLMSIEKGISPTVYSATKIISKERVIKTRQVEHTVNEKNILYCMDCRFVVRLFDYFQDKLMLYFVLEFVNGGEMFSHIQKQKRHRFSEEQTRFFSAETVLAFEYLHNLDIIFRDLKPENLLLDFRGHLRVTDFGFAKRVEDRTYTMCGTPEYLAPEIIVNKGYGHSVDWWAVGVLTYEMRCGHSPFEARSQMEMFKKITKRDLKFPREFTEHEIALIDGLLQVDLTHRLGNLVGGTDDIKRHKYFSTIDWDKMLTQSVKSPYIPECTGPDDCSNFDQYPEEPTKWNGEGEDKFGDTFVGF